MYDFDPGYILEKWNKYFGDAKPKDIPAPNFSSSEFPGLMDNITIKWIDRWGKDSYKEMSKYLDIIRAINEKPFIIYTYRGKAGEKVFKRTKKTENLWYPSGLVELFENSTEGYISDFEYRGLHISIEKNVEDWLENEYVKKDMRQIQRDGIIGDILS
jgi:hypothetical protein